MYEQKKRVEIYLGLGSNLGDKEKNLKQAIALLEEEIDLKKISPLYLTEPAYFLEQDTFLNAALSARTSLSPYQLLEKIQAIEIRLGRQRHLHYGPRTIDIDILFYGQDIIQDRFLQIPHPLLQERWFVLRPLADLNQSLVHPVLKKKIQELLEEVERRNL